MGKFQLNLVSVKISDSIVLIWKVRDVRVLLHFVAEIGLNLDERTSIDK